MVTCSFCGASAQPEPSDPASRSAAEAAAVDVALPLTWVTSHENGKRRLYCDRCARDYLRSIESKLDSEWW